MKLGFIGTGKITESVVTGISSSKIKYSKILVSPRNLYIAKKLSKKIKKVSIGKSNQEIINSCDWIFLAVTPTVGEKIIKTLKFKSNQIIISFISTVVPSLLKKFFNVLFGGKTGTGPFLNDIGGRGIALKIFAFTLINFFNLGKVIVEIKLIIIWLDLNFNVLIIFSPTVGVTARKIQSQLLIIS